MSIIHFLRLFKSCTLYITYVFRCCNSLSWDKQSCFPLSSWNSATSKLKRVQVTSSINVSTFHPFYLMWEESSAGPTDEIWTAMMGFSSIQSWARVEVLLHCIFFEVCVLVEHNRQNQNHLDWQDLQWRKEGKYQLTILSYYHDCKYFCVYIQEMWYTISLGLLPPSGASSELLQRANSTSSPSRRLELASPAKAREVSSFLEVVSVSFSVILF